MRYGIKDRVVDFFRNFCDKHNFKKENLSHILIAVGLSALIAFGIATGVSPSIDGVNDNIDSLGQTDDYILTTIDALLAQDADTASTMGGINSTVSGQVASINALALLLNGLQTDLDNLVCSPPDAYLGGTFGDYTLYVKSSKAGEFTANVHLVYAPPLSAGNATNYTTAVEYFCTGVNWTAANQLYIPTVAFNGTSWVICQVSFNAGTFTVGAGTEAIIPTSCRGLEGQPSYAYAEVYSVRQ